MYSRSNWVNHIVRFDWKFVKEKLLPVWASMAYCRMNFMFNFLFLIVFQGELCVCLTGMFFFCSCFFTSRLCEWSLCGTSILFCFGCVHALSGNVTSEHVVLITAVEQIGYRYHGLEIYVILNGMCPVFAVLTESNLEVHQHTREFCKPWLNQTDFPCFCFVHYKRFVISERNAIWSITCFRAA